MVFLSFAVLVPALCLLWFMGAAMRNERLAARQKLADAYRGELLAPQTRLGRYWKENAAQLETLAADSAPAVAFARCVQSGGVDSVVIYDEKGAVCYPNKPSAVNSDFGALESIWREAGQLEHSRKYSEAAKQYDLLARKTTNVHAAARAFQAEARCLLRAGKQEAAIQLVHEVFGTERYRQAVDPQGRLIAANAELMSLELMTNRDSPAFQSTAQRLAARLVDYENPALAAPQRRFLMKELQRLSPKKMELPTLAAEEFAAGIIENPVPAAGEFELRRSPLPDLWQFATPNGRVLALLRSDKVLAATKAALVSDHASAGVKITLLPPDADAADAFITSPAGEHMPGWRLALLLADNGFLDANAGRQTALYLWTGILTLAGMGTLTLVTLRLLRRQMTLARLKNDLAATVSHELKTPLASMRVLVETLLDREQLDEQQTRDYLQLIARENERLGRLIQNFLTFSRMERKKYAFHFSLLPARQIVNAAMEAAGGRFDGPGCRFEVQVGENLPPVMADPDALTAALINLLENAYKYSAETKCIVLRAWAEDGCLRFSVADKGIGIAARDRRKIFQPFYQVDQCLSRQGSGCGLGLSIVQFIATAHRGSVSVESQPGHGSTFTISLPLASSYAPVAKEVTA